MPGSRVGFICAVHDPDNAAPSPPDSPKTRESRKFQMKTLYHRSKDSAGKEYTSTITYLILLCKDQGEQKRVIEDTKFTFVGQNLVPYCPTQKPTELELISLGSSSCPLDKEEFVHESQVRTIDLSSIEDSLRGELSISQVN